jgi:hypothetical protein
MNEEQTCNYHNLHIEPCPCGNLHPQVMGDDFDSDVCCKNCGKITPSCGSTRNSIKFWNENRFQLLSKVQQELSIDVSKSYHIFTHNDLDGAISLLTFLWAKKDSTVTYQAENNLTIEKSAKNFIANAHNPPSVVFLDISLKDWFLPELDQDFVTVIDHHKRSEELIPKIKRAKIIHKHFSSNALFLYKTLEKSLQLTPEQKKLILFADDFDSDSHKFEQAYDLNLIFWSEYKDRFSDFIKDYFNGWKPFTDAQKERIKKIKDIINMEISKLSLFYGELTIQGKKKTVYAASGEKTDFIIVNELSKRNKSDLFFFINTKSQRVSLKQNTFEDPILLDVFAEKYCEGGGNDKACGGNLTDIFMQICKNFKPV